MSVYGHELDIGWKSMCEKSENKEGSKEINSHESPERKRRC